MPADSASQSLSKFDDKVSVLMTSVCLPVKNLYPPYSQHTQKMVTDWHSSSESAVLQVSSSLCDDEYNFILNSDHPDVAKIKVVGSKPFIYPDRLARNSD